MTRGRNTATPLIGRVMRAVGYYELVTGHPVEVNNYKGNELIIQDYMYWKSQLYTTIHRMIEIKELIIQDCTVPNRSQQK